MWLLVQEAGRRTAVWREAVVVQKVRGSEGLVDDIHAGDRPQTQSRRRRALVLVAMMVVVVAGRACRVL